MQTIFEVVSVSDYLLKSSVFYYCKVVGVTTVLYCDVEGLPPMRGQSTLDLATILRICCSRLNVANATWVFSQLIMGSSYDGRHFLSRSGIRRKTGFPKFCKGSLFDKRR